MGFIVLYSCLFSNQSQPLSQDCCFSPFWAKRNTKKTLLWLFSREGFSAIKHGLKTHQGRQSQQRVFTAQWWQEGEANNSRTGMEIHLVVLLALKIKIIHLMLGEKSKNGISCVLALSSRRQRSRCSLPHSHLADLQTLHLLRLKTRACKPPLSHLLRCLAREGMFS